jgi:hypothetical protein
MLTFPFPGTCFGLDLRVSFGYGGRKSKIVLSWGLFLGAIFEFQFVFISGLLKHQHQLMEQHCHLR